MNKQMSNRYRALAFGLGLALSQLISACAPTLIAPTTAVPTAMIAASATPLRLPSPTPLPPTTLASATSSSSPTSSPTPTATPAALPDFSYPLAAKVSNETYLKDPCQVISNRWDPQNASPGTIVVPVMIHSIARPGRAITDDTTITEDYYFRFINRAHELGFETITTAQLVGFLNHNAKIPALSLLLIVDDRKRGEFFETYFAPNFKNYHWTVTNAWIANPDTPAYLWRENERFIGSGMVDFQAHGVVHNIPMDDSVTADYIQSEIYGPIQLMEQHFGKRPIAFIWPRGLFTPAAVQVARQAGYQAGFSAYSRGPLMFNWIPLGEIERMAGDPLMVLPRYWSTTAITALDEAVQVSQASQDFYARQKNTQLAYLKQYCPGR